VDQGAASRDITTHEVPVAERGAILDAYQQRFRKMPRVAAMFRALPDPADHPTFLIESRLAD
jgi:hypothetical protein